MQRRKLLRLFYDDRISADLFAEEEARLSKTIASARGDLAGSAKQIEVADDLSRTFDEVARILADLDIERIWQAGKDVERRVLIDEFLEQITVLPDHLEVAISGAPPINVLYAEVGMKDSGFGGVGGGT